MAVYPPKSSTFKPEDNIIVGNVCLYGAIKVTATRMDLNFQCQAGALWQIFQYTYFALLHDKLQQHSNDVCGLGLSSSILCGSCCEIQCCRF